MGAQSNSAQLIAIRKILEDLEEKVEEIAAAVKLKSQGQTQKPTVKRGTRR